MTGQHKMAIEPSPGILSPEEARLFSGVIRALRARGVPFLVAGGFAFSHYSGFPRDTKDIDLIITTKQFDAAVEVLRDLGLRDYYEVEPYDRAWIHRAYQGECIVDLIHCFPNHVDEVDDSWFESAVPGEFAGEPVLYLAPEALIWTKLFVFQRDRCDWTDLLNIIRGMGGEIDWDRLLEWAGEHWRLLGALVDIYDWLCPDERSFVPAAFRARLRRLRFEGEGRAECRADLLDSRHWLTEPGAGLQNGNSADAEQDSTQGGRASAKKGSAAGSGAA